MKRLLIPILGLAAFAAAIFTLGCSSQAVKDTDVVATWGDTSMTVSVFKDWMNVRYRNEAQSMKQSLKDRYDVLDEYITRDCKILEAKRLGFDKREDIVKEVNNATQQKAIEVMYNEKVRDRAFTESQIKDYFNHDQEELRVRHILISMPDSIPARDTVKYWDRISEAYQKAKAGQDFTKLVDQYSEDSSVDPNAHGDLGYFHWGRMVDEFQDAAWKLKPGEISPIVRTRYGYHIIQMIDRRPSYIEYRTAAILVKVNRKDSPAETTLAFERAKMILAEAKKSGADFAQVARKYSEDDKSWMNGEIGWVARGTMPNEYWDLVSRMKIGEVAGPVRTYRGYFVVKYEETRQRPPSLDDKGVRDGVLSSLTRLDNDRVKRIADEYLDSVRAAFGMQYNEPVIKMLMNKLGNKSEPQNQNIFASLTPAERQLNVVDDKQGGVKVQELVDQYGDHRFPPALGSVEEFKTQMLDPLLTPKYLGEYAKEGGFFDRPDVKTDAVRALNNALLPAIEQEMIYDKANPTDDLMRTYYKNNLNKYSQPERRSGVEILLDDKQLANDLYGRIQKGEDIGTLARRYTTRSQKKSMGGVLGPFKQEELGPLSAKAFNMRIGEVAGPIDIDGKSWSIFKLTSIEQPKTQSFEEVAKQIESDLRFQLQKDLKDKWTAELKKAYDIKLSDNVIKAVWPIVEPLPESMVAERKGLEKQREEQAKRKQMENQIKLKLQPGSEQEFTTPEGKKVKVNIGQPRYVDKSGKEVDAGKANIRLSPSGRMETKDGKPLQGQPTIELKPKPVKPGTN